MRHWSALSWGVARSSVKRSPFNKIIWYDLKIFSHWYGIRTICGGWSETIKSVCKEPWNELKLTSLIMISIVSMTTSMKKNYIHILFFWISFYSMLKNLQILKWVAFLDTQIKEKPFYLWIKIGQLTLALRNLKLVLYLFTFRRINLDRDRIRLKLHVPALYLESKYTMEGRILMMPILGSGNFYGNYCEYIKL